jgi:hypothetical protein
MERIFRILSWRLRGLMMRPPTGFEAMGRVHPMSHAHLPEPAQVDSGF